MPPQGCSPERRSGWPWSPFDRQYNGRSLLWILENEAHAAFTPKFGQPLPPTINHDRLTVMMEAADHYGFDAFWKAERDWQAIMIAHMTLDKVETALKQYDSDPRNS